MLYALVCLFGTSSVVFNTISWYLANLPKCQKYYKNQNSACLQGKKKGTPELQILMVVEQMERIQAL